MISRDAADRTTRSIEEAVRLGARILLGGTSNGSYFSPTILTDAPPSATICSSEAFAPVVVLRRFTDFDEAIREVND